MAWGFSSAPVLRGLNESPHPKVGKYGAIIVNRLHHGSLNESLRPKAEKFAGSGSFHNCE